MQTVSFYYQLYSKNVIPSIERPILHCSPAFYRWSFDTVIKEEKKSLEAFVTVINKQAVKLES